MRRPIRAASWELARAGRGERDGGGGTRWVPPRETGRLDGARPRGVAPPRAERLRTAGPCGATSGVSSSSALGRGKPASGVPGDAGRKNARGPAWVLSPRPGPQKRGGVVSSLGGGGRVVVMKFTNLGVAVYSIS